jgi:hypothetical protein
MMSCKLTIKRGFANTHMDANFNLQISSDRYFNNRQIFKNTANNTMIENISPSIHLPDFTDLKIRQSAEKAFQKFGQVTQPGELIQAFRGGDHFCVTTEEIPEVIFKKLTVQGCFAPKEYALQYIEKQERARKICKENNLNLLYIPNCMGINLDPNIVIEEKVKLLDGGWYAQKACYKWIVYDPELKEYGKELLRQLAIFICLFGYRDVKYDNISLTTDGRIALFDTDENGGTLGLTSSRARGKGGFFNLIPLDWIEDFISIVEKNLNASDFEKFNQSIPKLREKAEKSSLRIKKLDSFYKEKNINIPNMSFTASKEDLEKCEPKIRIFIEVISKHINKEIEKLPLLSLLTGRKITIKTGRSEFGNDLRLNLDDSNFHTVYFENIRKLGLDTLKKYGYIYSYHIEQYSISLIC